MNRICTQEEVRNIFDYNPDSGKLIWKNHRSSKCRKGQSPNYIAPSGYISVQVNKKLYKAHRLIWLWWYGYLPENDIDHIDGDRTNNTLSNLREVSRSCNLFNRRDTKRISNTGITGVYQEYKTGRYHAKIFILGKSVHLCCTLDLVEAVAHRLAAEECLGVDFYLSTPAKVFMDTWKIIGDLE